MEQVDQAVLLHKLTEQDDDSISQSDAHCHTKVDLCLRPQVYSSMVQQRLLEGSGHANWRSFLIALRTMPISYPGFLTSAWDLYEVVGCGRRRLMTQDVVLWCWVFGCH